MASEINEKTKVPLGVVVGIVVAIMGSASNLAVSHYRLSEIEKWRDRHVEESSKDLEFTRAQELKVQRLEITLQNIGATLERLNDHLDALERRK